MSGAVNLSEECLSYIQVTLAGVYNKMKLRQVLMTEICHQCNKIK